MQPEENPQNASRGARASGVPAWVTQELIRRTLAVWQPYYGFSLTTDDAVGIILRVGTLMNVLARR